MMRVFPFFDDEADSVRIPELATPQPSSPAVRNDSDSQSLND
jgi:hypothetical protein